MRVALDFLEREWQAKCERYLPIVPDGSVWRFSRTGSPDDPEQGWKIHVSATILSAARVLERVAPFLNNERILFKAPVSLQELKKINCGLFYGFSQVGKLITVYPPNPEVAVKAALKL